MPGTGIGLFWRPEVIEKIMSDHGIQRRWQLAERLEAVYGIGKTTVYRVFTEDWQGMASTTVLAALSEMFRIPLNMLVNDPSERKSA